MKRVRVCVVGSSTHFVSGISYYTAFLSRRLAEDYHVSVILMRSLIPRALYPGRRRVGTQITDVTTVDVAPTFNGVDWTVIPTLPRALRFLRSQEPEIVVLQWWTAATLPAYLAITAAAKKRGAAVVLEMHEEIHASEASIPVLGSVARIVLDWLLKRVDAYVVHSEFDKLAFAANLNLPLDRIYVIPLGPFMTSDPPSTAVRVRASDEPVTLLFFGTIRPYKGLEDLVEAFDLLPRGDGQVWKLVIVGEPWEGWTLPFEKLERAKYRDDIELINRYVPDEDVPGYFARADIVALPYLRSHASGPLHLTMARGLPVVVTRVGGLECAVRDYEGAVLVDPESPEDLAEGIVKALPLVGRNHPDPHSWDMSASRFGEIFEKVT